jgi:hypothetical protein
MIMLLWSGQLIMMLWGGDKDMKLVMPLNEISIF